MAPEALVRSDKSLLILKGPLSFEQKDTVDPLYVLIICYSPNSIGKPKNK